MRKQCPRMLCPSGELPGERKGRTDIELSTEHCRQVPNGRHILDRCSLFLGLTVGGPLLQFTMRDQHLSLTSCLCCEAGLIVLCAEMVARIPAWTRQKGGKLEKIHSFFDVLSDGGVWDDAR